MPVSIKTLLDEAIQALPNSDSATVDAESLLSHVIGKSRSYFYTWPDNPVTDQQRLEYRALVQERSTGKPVAHLIRQRSFWNQALEVTPESLIPRPETELLVEMALEIIPADSCFQIADLGTGTGAVAIAIACERLNSCMTATDIILNNLLLARRNAIAHSAHNIQFVNSHWLRSIEDHAFDVIVSNPPYIAHNDPHLDQGDLRFESRIALVSGEDGLDAIRRIVISACRALKKNGWLLLEHGYQQSVCVKELMLENGYVNITTKNDLNGNPRVTMGCYQPKTK